MRTRVVFCLLVCTLAIANIAAASPITFNFNTGTGQQFGPLTNSSCNVGQDHNCSSSAFTQTSGAITLSATAWAIADSAGHESGNFAAAELGSYSIGLAVCDVGDGGPNCGSPEHQADNFGGSDDFLLINFGTQVTLNSVQLYTYDDSDGNGRNISYWVGNAIPNGSLTSDSTANFTFTNVVCPGACTNPATETITGTGQYLLIGPSLTDDPGTCSGRHPTCNADEFKLQDLTITPLEQLPPPTPTPEPLSMVLFGTGLVFGARKFRRQR